jgi:hypothetical protein
MRPVDRVLERAQNVREVGSGWLVSCPNKDHGQGRGDRNPSLSVGTDAEGNVLLKCFAACENERVVEALGLKMADLFEHHNGSGDGHSGRWEFHTSPKTPSPHRPCTLEDYAAYVGLPIEFLKSLKLSEISYEREPAVRMPYFDKSGEELLLTRFRVSLASKPKIKTKSGNKHRLYGLWNLEEAHKTGYAWLVEGESDCQTLWYHGEPALGIPGAHGWKAEWAADLEGIERLYFVVEDEAGEACWRKLAATPEIRERLYRVELDDVKDVSELHKQDSGSFKERLASARTGARAWLDIAETEQEERSREAWAECQELAESPDILALFSKDLKGCGVVGEEKNGQLLYLALTSRLLDKIVSVAIKGPSSGGKSYLLKQVLSFVPESTFCQFTAMSEKTLLYTDEPLSQRHIILSEAAGTGSEFQDYVIRTLLSEGFLDYEFVEKTSEGLRPRRIRKEGPTGFITTTTRDRLHAENETRYLSLTVTDTREQTRRIFHALAEEHTEEPDRTRWHALQVWLEGAEHRVQIPYAKVLADKMGNVAVRLRRDFSVILSLIRARAILHQATRERDEEGRIVASIEDYARVRELVADLVAEGVEATVPPIVRETVEAVEEIIRDGEEEHATNTAVAKVLDMDKAAASRRVRTAIGRGYLKNLEDRRGRPARLVVGEPMPEDQEVLPACEVLEEVLRCCAVDGDQERVSHPPSPAEEPSEGKSGGGESYITPKSTSTDQQLNTPSEDEHALRVREAFDTPGSGAAKNLELFLRGKMTDLEYLTKSVLHTLGESTGEWQEWLELVFSVLEERYDEEAAKA